MGQDSTLAIFSTDSLTNTDALKLNYSTPTDELDPECSPFSSSRNPQVISTPLLVGGLHQTPIQHQILRTTPSSNPPKSVPATESMASSFSSSFDKRMSYEIKDEPITIPAAITRQ